MYYFDGSNLPKPFNPFEAYSEGGNLTQEFVDYMLNLVDTNLSQAYATFKNMKKSGYKIDVNLHEVIEEAIQRAYNPNPTAKEDLEMWETYQQRPGNEEKLTIMPILKIIYMTETTVGDGSKKSPFRIVKHFWEKNGDVFNLLYSVDTFTNALI